MMKRAAGTDRTIRSLAGLSGASSSRVLNLAAIAEAEANNPGHREAPFFDSPVLNAAIIVKHRLRADEVDLFEQRRAIATKVIFPFERTDLRAGGRSLFVGQLYFESMLQDIGNYSEKIGMVRDLEALRILDKLPSLDPFLLREHLLTHDIAPHPCYFAISNADQERMFDYVVKEMRQLTSLALSRKTTRRETSTSKMVEALLSNSGLERLEPLRLTLQLEAKAFDDGVFSWRGFLYYKWSLEQHWPNIVKVLRHISAIRPLGKLDHDQIVFLNAMKRRLILGVKENTDDVRKILAVYNDAYSKLIVDHDPRVFREFLLSAPELFLELGEKIGAISHVTSFWQYRFPSDAPRLADGDELMSIFQDFGQSFGTAARIAA